MIRLFRSFSPVNIVWLAIFLFLMRISFAYHVPDKVGFPFTELFSRLLLPVSRQTTIPPVVNLFLASLLIFIQAILINFLANKHNLLGKSTFLPAFMYVTLSSLFIPFLMLSPGLVCNFLLIWMLFKLLDLYKGDAAKSICYDLGMIVAVGTMIYLPFIYMFLVIWVGLAIFRPFDWREWIAGMIGFITIFFFLAVFYYLNDKLGEFFEIWRPLGTKFPVHFTINYYNYLVLIPVIIILVLCALKLQQNFYKSYVHIRKSIQLLFFVFLIAAFSFYIRTDFRVDHFLLCAVPASIFVAYYFLYATARWFYESLYILLLASIIYFQFNTF
ncbi:MAG TPA: DUF6427 family protein [Mucilaginibacter sp.]|jgi:hypothetical protein|nr:DUF6427 family protein [Mucilaginibacter sp.]